MVISPYSSFLALAVDPIAAVRNLRRLRDIGAYGRWGYIEALDFTPGRCRRADGEQVRCYMAHHVSMSLLAAANAADGGCVQKLFMADASMAAYTLLLQEKLPDSSVVMRRDSSPVPERPRQHDKSRWELRGSEANAGAHACLLSNGAYSIRVTDDGNSAAFLGGCCVYDCRRPDDTLCLRLNGKKLLPAGGEYAWTLSEDHAAWSFEQNGAQCAVTLAAIDGELGELTEVQLRGAGRAELELGFRPVLAAPRDVESHSAYWKLGMTAQEGENSILLHRLPKGDKPGIWLCLACDHPVRFAFDELKMNGASY